jgi:hypothetical protein
MAWRLKYRREKPFFKDFKFFLFKTGYIPRDFAFYRALFGRVATFSENSVSARLQTGFCFQCLSSRRCGRSASLKASDASRGKRDGKWSIEITVTGGSLLTSTGTVGLSNVVAIV